MRKSIVYDDIKNKGKGQNIIAMAFFLFCAVWWSSTIFAASTGVEFQAVYDFVYGAATGYLGRAIAITGGLIGLGFGAASGRPVIAVVGIVLAIFGALGPTIIDTIFASALI